MIISLFSFQLLDCRDKNMFVFVYVQYSVDTKIKFFGFILVIFRYVASSRERGEREEVDKRFSSFFKVFLGQELTIIPASLRSLQGCTCKCEESCMDESISRASVGRLALGFMWVPRGIGSSFSRGPQVSATKRIVKKIGVTFLMDI